MEDLLEGLEGEARAARAALLEELRASGVTDDELRAAAAEDRLVLLPIERALLSAPVYTLADVAERSGTPLEAVQQRLRLIGIPIPEDPDTRAFGTEDVEAAQRLVHYAELGIDVDAARETMRTLAGSMSRAAEPLRRLFAQSFLEAGMGEDDLARVYGEKAVELMPLVGADMEYLLRHHLRDFARHEAVGMAERQSGTLAESAQIAVAFADIVGFTQLGQDVPEGRLTDIAERLDILAGEVCRRPTRAVKTIGDAVMLVSPDPGALLDVTLALLEAADADADMPPLRAGLAWGRAVARLGDWFGTPVNLAARLTDRARPESVLTTNELRDALDEDAAARFHFSEAGLKKLKGFPEAVPTLRVRRPPSS